MVDLDQTLIHTTNENIDPKIDQVLHFQLWPGAHTPWWVNPQWKKEQNWTLYVYRMRNANCMRRFVLSVLCSLKLTLLVSSAQSRYHTRIRPHTKAFLENINKLYELHIVTFGSRMYAHTVAKFIDPQGKLFSHRILSRDECFDSSSKTANLKGEANIWNWLRNAISTYAIFDRWWNVNWDLFSQS